MKHGLGYTTLFCFKQGFPINVVQWLIKRWTVPAVVERTYLWAVYGDCIGFSSASLCEAVANSIMERLVFRRSKISWLGIFLIKSPKVSGWVQEDLKKAWLGQTSPFAPGRTFFVMKPFGRGQLRWIPIRFWQIFNYYHFPFLAFRTACNVVSGHT